MDVGAWYQQIFASICDQDLKAIRRQKYTIYVNPTDWYEACRELAMTSGGPPLMLPPQVGVNTRTESVGMIMGHETVLGPRLGRNQVLVVAHGAKPGRLLALIQSYCDGMIYGDEW